MGVASESALVLKKDGTWRICFYYQKLIAVTPSKIYHKINGIWWKISIIRENIKENIIIMTNNKVIIYSLYPRISNSK
jgi:hypothetical protein